MIFKKCIIPLHVVILISCLVASPVAWYFMHGWLEKYEYRIDVNPMIFLCAALIAIFISLITISFQIIRAAVANPIKSLRSE